MPLFHEHVPSAVVGLLGALGLLAGLRRGLTISDFDYDLPQQRHDLLRLESLHWHTSFPAA